MPINDNNKLFEIEDVLENKSAPMKENELIVSNLSDEDVSVMRMSCDDGSQNSENSSVNRARYKQSPRKSRKVIQIGVQRLSQRIKANTGIFWSGHMLYYTNINTDV